MCCGLAPAAKSIDDGERRGVDDIDPAGDQIGRKMRGSASATAGLKFPARVPE